MMAKACKINVTKLATIWLSESHNLTICGSRLNRYRGRYQLTNK